jgi:hypothetical protein
LAKKSAKVAGRMNNDGRSGLTDDVVESVGAEPKK